MVGLKTTMSNSLSMAQQRIFITGGASGLGKAIALCFAAENWRVCIGDIQADAGEATLDELKKRHPQSCYVHCDVRELGAVEGARDQLVERWGGVDVVVNNAGVAGSAGFIEDISLDDWHWVMDINLLGVIRVYRAFAPLLKAQHGGHFVNIASAAGLMNAPKMASYNATKAAVISLAETTRLELAPFNVAVSVACPGFFPTALAGTVRSASGGTQLWIEKAMAHSGVSAEDVAGEIYRGVIERRFWVLPHKLERRLWRLKRWLPALFFRLMSTRTHRLIDKI